MRIQNCLLISVPTQTLRLVFHWKTFEFPFLFKVLSKCSKVNGLTLTVKIFPPWFYHCRIKKYDFIHSVCKNSIWSNEKLTLIKFNLNLCCFGKGVLLLLLLANLKLSVGLLTAKGWYFKFTQLSRWFWIIKKRTFFSSAHR